MTRMPTRPLLLATIAAFLCAAAVSHGATRYAEVAGDGPASGVDACPSSNPCDLQAAVEDPSVADGDEVVVRSGTYDLGAGILKINDSITVRGEAAGQRPLIAGTGDGVGLGLVEVRGPDVGPPAQLLDLDISASGTNSLFISRGEANRVSADQSGGIYAVACQLGYEATIRDSVCFSRSSNGAGLLFSVSGGNASNSIRNVTAASIQSIGIQLHSDNGSHNLEMQNTIATGATDVKVSATASGAATLNAVGSNYSSTNVTGPGPTTLTTPGTAGNQTQDPVFADFVLGDFHQARNSPTIDAGTDGVSALDLDGQSRFQGALPDIGAYEYDQVQPETTIGKRPKAKTTSRRALLKFTANEPGSKFRCKVDRKPYRSCKSPLRLKRLALGRHKVAVKAVDPSGNADPSPAVARWRVLPA